MHITLATFEHMSATIVRCICHTDANIGSILEKYTRGYSDHRHDLLDSHVHAHENLLSFAVVVRHQGVDREAETLTAPELRSAWFSLDQ